MNQLQFTTEPARALLLKQEQSGEKDEPSHSHFQLSWESVDSLWKQRMFQS